MPSHRQERLNGVIREELTHLIQNEVIDPMVGSVTVTRVAASRDLTTARIFVTIENVEADSPEAEECLTGLKRAEPFLRRRLAQDANLRRTPELIFTFDASEQVLRKIEQLVNDAKPNQEDPPSAEVDVDEDETLGD